MAEYPYPLFKHGTYGDVDTSGVDRVGNGKTKFGFVYFGTAPVGHLDGAAKAVNKPIVCRNMTEAKALLGYSDDFAKYTLCEAMKVHFEHKGVGPVIFVNVLKPTTHKASTASTASLTPSNGRVIIAAADDIIMDTIVIVKGTDPDTTTLVKDEDYSLKYDDATSSVIVTELTAGALGTAALAITYYKMNASAVVASDVIGTTDGYGVNTGLYVLDDIYTLTGYVPAYISAPGWDDVPTVHAAMAARSTLITKHWDAWMFVNMPLTDGGTPITLATAPTWKNTNGYNKDNEDVYFGLADCTDGKKYHLSVWSMANFQELLIANDGVPYMTSSNTQIPIMKKLYLGAAAETAGQVITDDLINRTLNANGINSACMLAGSWVLWGMFAGSYSQDNATPVNTFDTARMMLFYLTNDFQSRHMRDIDKLMSVNDLKSMRADEQARVDALVSNRALSYGAVILDGSPEAQSDVYTGDFRLKFQASNTPLTKSLTSIIEWVPDGFQEYISAMVEELAA